MSNYRAEVYDVDGVLLTEVKNVAASAFLYGGSAATFEPYTEDAFTLRIYDGDRLVGAYRTMTPPEFAEWERDCWRTAGDTE